MLTDIKIRNLKPKNREYGTADSHGLEIRTTPKGVKLWRYRYRFNRKATSISVGKYPAVSLSEARKQRDIYQKVLFDGINPKVYKDNLRKTQQNKITFREAFDKWFALHKDEWGERTSIKQLRAFELHIFPEIGDTLVEDIKPIDMLKVFRKMDDKGISETLKKVRGWSSRVFCDCVVLEIILSDPTRDLPKDSFKKQKSKNYATVTTPDDIKDLLKTLIKYKEMGTYQVAEALNLAPYLLLRPGELTKTKWDEIDFKSKLIRISAERMKMSKDHLVPISTQVFTKLKKIKDFGLSDKYVFPSPSIPNSCINAETLRAAIRRLGIPKERFTTHGFRGMASTMLNELGYRGDIVEIQLSHTDSNKVRKAYNHAQYLDERRDMMQAWSDYLDKLKTRAR